MTWRRFTAGPDRAMDILNNALSIGPFPASGLALGGRTLIFTTPAATVTFPGAANAVVTLAAVVAAIVAAAPSVHVERRPCASVSGAPPGPSYYLALWRDGGLALSKDGTANALFGLSTTAVTQGKAPISLSAVKSVSRTATQEYECIVGGADADFDSPNPDGSSSSGGGAGALNYVVVP